MIILYNQPKRTALRISGVQTKVCSWFTRETAERRGTQIDLVMQRAVGFTDICEMKHSSKAFTIDDVTTIINHILNSVQENASADVNKDGQINISDVTKLINFLLGSTLISPVDHIVTNVGITLDLQ